jgi:hypothetical protein
MSELGEKFVPNPTNLLEANRSIGYNIEEAVADLIDNSISANAKNISYHIIKDDVTNPKFVLFDDGIGMSIINGDLINSFRLASINPTDERSEKDLGRFGFGMKTASLSQSKSFIVITKKENEDLVARSLDLEFIKKENDWVLKKISDQNEFLGFDQKIIENGSGTAIIWNKWDKSPSETKDFQLINSKIRDYISVCFHRYIEKGINLYSNESLIKKCSPIPEGEGSSLQSDYSLKESGAKLKSFLIQHPSKWEDDHDNSNNINSFKLFNGFDRQQGVYIYRCDRLLTPKGGWLGLIRSGNHSKLARVTIDFPNNADSSWSLDIKKTSATIPYKFREEIKKLISATRAASTQKINRGNRLKQSELDSVNGKIWNEFKNQNLNSVEFKINLENMFFQHFQKKYDIESKDFISIFKIISDCLPRQRIIQINDEDASSHDRVLMTDKLNESEINAAKKIFNILVSENGNKMKAFNKLMGMEPFCYYEIELKKIFNE